MKTKRFDSNEYVDWPPRPLMDSVPVASRDRVGDLRGAAQSAAHQAYLEHGEGHLDARTCTRPTAGKPADPAQRHTSLRSPAIR